MGNVQVSETILEAMRREARASGKDVNGLFEEAAELLLAHRDIDELAGIGEGHTRRLRRVPADAVRFVRDDRNEHQRER